MKIPPEIKFHECDRSTWVEDYIRERLQKLDRIADGDITSAVVTVSGEHLAKTKGNVYGVMVNIHVPPNHELVVNKSRPIHDMHMEMRPLVKQAFEAMERQLKETLAKRRYDTKIPEYSEQPTGMIEKLFSDYGFIRTVGEDREFYFHRNSVLHGDFDRLSIGTEVRFQPQMGEEGPQASSVQIVSKPGASPL
ncbi:MAG: HPF/RaiA family ribosome-associated protein [Pseudomonadota bacterium]